ncbi:putative RNA-directed DNA polymerase [Tanacetum coccineum]
MEGVDYRDTFSPVTNLVNARTLIDVAVKKEWVINQLDVNNAFLHGDLNEEASRNWYQKFTSSLLELGFKQCKADYSLFIFKKDACFVAALIYVDDVIMALVLSQRKYILDILEDCGFQGCKPSPFPFELNLILDKRDTEPKVDVGRYRRLVGRLLHMDAAHQVLRYLKGTVGQGILLPRDGGCNLTAYCDSDWLGCPITRRSRTGYLLLFEGAPISWKTKKQNVVSRSSAEAEYRSMASTVSEILLMQSLLKGLNIVMTGPTPFFCDNQAARHIANNPVFHE